MVFDSPTPDRIWKKDETASLITLYESEQCLYDNNDPRYFDTEAINNAYQRIHQIMLRIRPDCQLSHIKRRIKFLRSRYAAERLRKDVTIKSGMYTEETYKPNLWCFALLQFLDDFLPSVKNSEIKEIEEEMNKEPTMEDEQNENFTLDSRTDYQNNKDTAGSSNGIHEINDDTNSNEGSGKKKRKLDSITRISSREQNIAEKVSVPQPLEREDIFGQYVASEMKTLRDNPLLYLQTKQAILEILTSANFELINPE